MKPNPTQFDQQPTPAQIGAKHFELRMKLKKLKEDRAPYEELVKVAKAIQLSWDYYQKAKFGRVKSRLSVEGIMRDSYL